MNLLAKSYFDSVVELEERNRQETRLRFPQHVIMLEDCESLYRFFLNDAVDPNLIPYGHTEYVESMKTCSDLPNELVLSSLALFRGHLDDSHYHLRRTPELFGFVRLMLVEPESAHKWKSASQSEEAYREYRHAFETRKILPKNIDGMDLLFEQYDRSTKYTHASVLAVESHLIMTQNATGVTFHGTVFSTNLYTLSFKKQAVAIGLTHILIIGLLMELFKNCMSAKKLHECKEKMKHLRDEIHPLNEELKHDYGEA
jgi:hypothetical protein